MFYAIAFLSCIAALATLLEPHWAWSNLFFGAIATHILIGNVYMSRAIESYCYGMYQGRPLRRSPVHDCLVFASLEPLGALFFGVYGTSLGDFLKSLYHG